MLSDLELKFNYDSDYDDLTEDFYSPVLSNSKEYDLMSGFLSTKSLAVSTKGIVELIRNNGKMRLICTAKLSKENFKTIEEDYENIEEYLIDKFTMELHAIEGIVEEQLEALGWLISKKLLEIKIAVPYEDKCIINSKIGVVRDSEDNSISFTGSNNETIRGELSDIEEFKVFKSWEENEEKYVEQDLENFNKYFNNETDKLNIIPLPDAIKHELISIAPFSKLELKLLKNNKKIKLRDYQVEAVNAWFDNDCKGLYEMATGTGKTFTALAAFKKVSSSTDKLLTVIACPQSHLIDQWANDVEKFHDGQIIFASGKNSNWKKDLLNLRKNFYFGSIKKAVVMTSHATLYKDFFIKSIKNIKNVEKMIIVDEVHGIGSPKQSKGLIDDYKYRLGLSATPNRWMDEIGTEIVFNYFNKVVYEFDIKKALTEINPDTGETYLAPYEYKPRIVDLSAEEYEKYNDYASKIDNLLSKDKYNKSSLNKLFSGRQELIDNAYAKYTEFVKILDENHDINKLIIFCSSRQIDDIQDILNKKGVFPQHRFTQTESANITKKNPKSERETLLYHFKEGDYKALVAIKCLDEGVDVPSAENAIIMSSTSNPREHVQRRGRILRRSPGKEKATIYDILVFPKDKTFYGSNLVKKDIDRYNEFAENAINSEECKKELKDIKNKIDNYIN